MINVVHSSTKVLRLVWTESTDSYTVVESMVCWLMAYSLICTAKHTGQNLKYILLDNFSAVEGLQNLSVLEKDNDAVITWW